MKHDNTNYTNFLFSFSENKNPAGLFPDLFTQ